MVSPEPVRRNLRHLFNQCNTPVLTIVLSRPRTARVKLYLHRVSILFLRFLSSLRPGGLKCTGGVQMLVWMRHCAFLVPRARIIVFPSIPSELALIVCTDNFLPDFSSSVTTKKTESGENDRFAFGVSEMQGWRVGAYEATTSQISPFLPFISPFLARSSPLTVFCAIT